MTVKAMVEGVEAEPPQRMNALVGVGIKDMWRVASLLRCVFGLVLILGGLLFLVLVFRGSNHLQHPQWGAKV